MSNTHAKCVKYSTYFFYKKTLPTWKDYGIGTLHYNWPISAHASQAFSMYTSARDCTDSKHLPKSCAILLKNKP